MKHLEVDYSDFVKSLIKPGKEISKNITPEEANLLHLIVGLSGEVGELLDTIKKHCIYKKDLDIENVVEELGDIEFFMEGIRAALSISRNQCIEENKDKLMKRYSSGKYSNKQAQERKDKL
jgi:NTP pyrophosphatase (non-canonical NTP hydrolase)